MADPVAVDLRGRPRHPPVAAQPPPARPSSSSRCRRRRVPDVGRDRAAARSSCPPTGSWCPPRPTSPTRRGGAWATSRPANLIVGALGKGSGRRVRAGGWPPRDTGSATSPLFTCPSDHLIEGDAKFQHAVGRDVGPGRRPTPARWCCSGPSRLGPTRPSGYLLADGATTARPGRGAGARSRSRDERRCRGPDRPWLGLLEHRCATPCAPSSALEVYRRRRPEMMVAVEEHFAAAASTGGYDGPAAEGSGAGALLRGRRPPALVVYR